MVGCDACGGKLSRLSYTTGAGSGKCFLLGSKLNRKCWLRRPRRGIALDQILTDELCDQGGGGDCNQHSQNSRDGLADDDGNDDSNRGQMHARFHDTRIEKSIFQVVIDQVEDRNSQNLAKTIKRSDRSEEHTSELQSHLNLVCRLLLEKKKTQHILHLK